MISDRRYALPRGVWVKRQEEERIAG